MPILVIGVIQGGMVKVDAYLQIRLLHREGVSIRQIASRLGHGRETVKKALVDPVPRGYRRSCPAACPKLTAAHQQLIDQILVEDESAPRKQRHTSARMFARLRDEHGYAGKYDQVRRYVCRRRKQERETHLLLDHPPGGRLECDFGHIHVDYPQGRHLKPVLLAVWSYSHMPFAIALPDETTGSILHALVCAVEFFGCVPAELWWDNPTTVAKSILRGRDRTLNPHYGALASHYRFAPLFCLVKKGQEKSDVERTVFALQRRFATPVPQVKDDDELNRHLLACCLKERNRTVAGRTESIGVMFQQERKAAAALPPRPFDCGMPFIRQADKYQTVLFEDVRYSVPRHVAFEPVTVKAYLDQVVLVHKGQVVARHRRSRTAGEQVLEPVHFLSVLGRKPAYLDQTKLFKELKLPPAFTHLRQKLSALYGDRTGTRHYIRVLQLLACHSMDRVVQAIEACIPRQMLTAEIITARLQSSRATAASESCIATAKTTEAGSSLDESIARRVHVPPPDLRRFDQLLNHYSFQEGDDSHVRTAVEAQPQDAAFADDAGTVCQAVA